MQKPILTEVDPGVQSGSGGIIRSSSVELVFSHIFLISSTAHCQIWYSIINIVIVISIIIIIIIVINIIIHIAFTGEVVLKSVR